MNKLQKGKRILLLVLVVLSYSFLQAQDTTSVEKPAIILSVGYYNTNGQYPFIRVNAKSKIDGRFKPVSGMAIKVFMDNTEDSAMLLGSFKSDEKGEVKAVLTPAVGNAWKQLNKHSFIAVANASKINDEVQETIEITKSKITIDAITNNGNRSLKVAVFAAGDEKWVPLPDVEFKMGVARLGGTLPVSEEESFTTDSSGAAIVEFSRLNLPGDANGHLDLVASVEENEMIGNVSSRINVPWGTVPVNYALVLKRSLWGTGTQTPWWLQVTIFTIIALVWGTLFYLFNLFIKIRKLGRMEDKWQYKPADDKKAELVG